MASSSKELAVPELLFEYQHAGADWLAERRRAILGDTPGLGKTRTLLQASLLVDVNNPLVICPAIAQSHWQAEGRLLGMEPRVYSYEMYQRAILRAGGTPDTPRVVITDEHHYLKRMQSNRTRAILGVDGPVRRAEYAWGGSGTFPPRHPGEVWATLASMFPELAYEYRLGSYADFEARFLLTISVRCPDGTWRKKVMGMKNDEQFRALMLKMSLRRTPSMVGLDVPSVFWQVHMLDSASATRAIVDMPGAEQAYLGRERIERWIALGGSLEEIVGDGHVSRYLRRLGMVKAKTFLPELISQLRESDEKLVLFAHHSDVIDCLAEELEEFQPAIVTGRNRNTRDAEVERFQHDANCRLFIGQNKVCEASLTLTAASRAILLEPDWAAGTNYQLGQRVARIGQKSEHCIAQMVCLAGTIDEAVVRQNHRETAMLQRIHEDTR